MLISPAYGETLVALPSGFEYSISSTDCRTVTIVAELSGSSCKFQRTTTLPAGESSVSLAPQVPAGQYFVYVESSDTLRISSDRLGATYIIVEVPKCPLPTIVHPARGKRFQTLPGATVATTQYDLLSSFPCTDIVVTHSRVDDGSEETYILSGSTSYTPTRNLPPGGYYIRAIARDPSEVLPESLPTSYIYFEVDPPLAM